MKIIDVALTWTKGITVRKSTDAIVVHHAAMDGAFTTYIIFTLSRTAGAA